MSGSVIELDNNFVTTNELMVEVIHVVDYYYIQQM